MKDKHLVSIHSMDIKLDRASLFLKAGEVGFIRRIRKFDPVDFIKTLCLMALYTSISLEICATALGLVAGSVLSKQALAKRINSRCVAFVQSVLLALTLRASALQPLRDKGAFAPFRRVLLQDSTALSVPESLAWVFPGASNQRKKKTAILKIQVIHDLLSERYLHFGLSGFTRNDQSASPDILPLAAPGDLIIRDLGYFCLDVFEKLQQKGSYLLTRYSHTANLYTDAGERIELLKLLRKHPFFDATVLVGSRKRLPLRLIASPAPEPIARMRRRRLVQNHDHRRHPTKDQLALLGWDILLTNVGQDIWDAKTACKAYGIRWRIEIVFKSWKSRFHLNSLPRKAGRAYIELLVYSRLIFITLFQSCFAELAAYASKKGKPLSLLKAAQFIQQHLWTLILIPCSPQAAPLVLGQILKHCTYETRHKRRNYHEKLSVFLS